MLHKILEKLFGGLFARVVADHDHNDVARLDPHLSFLDSIANLSPAERAQRIETRQRYMRFAQHQSLIEAENQADALRNH